MVLLKTQCIRHASQLKLMPPINCRNFPSCGVHYNEENLGGAKVYVTYCWINPNAAQTSPLLSLKTEIVMQLADKPENYRSTYIDAIVHLNNSVCPHLEQIE